jgi:hypothetical protein
MKTGWLAALAFCCSIVLGGFVAACAPEENAAEATPVETMTGLSAANDNRPLPTPASVQSYRAGEDAIAALIPAE